MPLASGPFTSRRGPVGLLVALGVLLNCFVGVAPATAAGPTSLRDVRGWSQGGFIVTAAPDCTAATAELSYELSTPVSGSVVGTYRESGTVTMGAVTSSGRRAVTGVNATFTINDGLTDVVQGVKTLAPARQYTPYGSYDFMNEVECETGYHQVTFGYEASSGGVVFERGHATASGAASRALTPTNFSSVDFWAKPRVRLLSGGTTEGGAAPADHWYGSGVRLVVSPVPIADVSVRVRSLSTGTATSLDDYAPVDQTVTVPGLTGPQSFQSSVAVPVSVVDDAVAEGIETVDLEASEATGAFIDAPSGTLQVIDNEAVVALSSVAGVGETDGQLQVKATLGQPALHTVEVCVQPTANGSAEYGDPSSPTSDVVYAGWDPVDPQTCGYEWVVTVPEGASAGTITPPLQLVNDTLAEWDETIEFGARWVVGGTVSAAAAVSSTVIVDDDGEPDRDGDLILDLIDTDPAPSAGFQAGGTSGTIVDSGGNAIRISDAPHPSGVRIEVMSTLQSTAAARLVVCGFELHLTAGSDVRETCGSLASDVRAGRATVFLDAGTTVEVGPGVVAKVDTVDGVHTIQVLEDTQGTGAVLTVNGVVTTVSAGDAPVQMDVWHFTGFGSPVDNGEVVNSVQAGKAVPLKWRLLTARGEPVVDLGAATLSFESTPCTGGTADAVEQLAAGSSGLQNLGDGYYQMNWKTEKAAAGRCGDLVVDMGKVSGHARFQLVP